MRDAIVSVVVLLWSASALAGEIKMTTMIHNDDGQTHGQHAKLNGSNFDFQETSPGVWEFKLKDATSVFNPVTVVIESLPAGYEGFNYQLDIPFTWADKHLTLYAILANDETTDPGAQVLFDDMVGGFSSGRPEAMFVLNERARRLYKQRHETIARGRPPTKIDVKVAYWLLSTWRELYQHWYIALDDATLDARNWLMATVATRPDLFGTSTVLRTELEKLVAEVDQRDNVIYAKMVDAISGLVSAGGDDEMTGCVHARALRQALRDMVDDDYQRVTQSFSVDLRNTTLVAVCLAHGFARSQKANAGFGDEDVALAKSVHADLRRLIPQFTGQVREDAVKRKMDLAAFVPDPGS